MDGWKDGWMDGDDGWMDRWMEMDAWMNCLGYLLTLWEGLPFFLKALSEKEKGLSPEQ